MPHVLIAHTSIGTRTLLRIVFERKRYPTDIVSSPDEALTTASQRKPDLAILDSAYESVSGFDLADELRTLHPNLPIMICARFVSEQDIIQANAKDIILFGDSPVGHHFNDDLYRLLNPTY